MDKEEEDDDKEENNKDEHDDDKENKTAGMYSPPSLNSSLASLRADVVVVSPDGHHCHTASLVLPLSLSHLPSPASSTCVVQSAVCRRLGVYDGSAAAKCLDPPDSIFPCIASRIEICWVAIFMNIPSIPTVYWYFPPSASVYREHNTSNESDSRIRKVKSSNTR